MSDDRPWFTPKRFGVGVHPASRAGWLLTLGYTAAILALLAIPARLDMLRIGLAAALTIGFIALVVQHTGRRG